MKRLLRAIVLIGLIVLVLPARPGAHQLDEYLQATRVQLARNRIVVEIDLTPGANVAGEIIAVIDRDADGVVLPLEARAYGEAVIGDLELAYDDRPVRLMLSTIEVPTVAEMYRGVGTMQLTAEAAIDDVRAGTRRLRLSNHHRPAMSVYLANPLVSTDSDVQVVAQRRDRRQQQLDVEYAIASRWSLHLIAMLFGATLMISQIAARRSRTASSSPERYSLRILWRGRSWHAKS